MWRRRPRVAGISNGADYISPPNALPFPDQLLIKVGVVVAQVALPIIEPNGFPANTGIG